MQRKAIRDEARNRARMATDASRWAGAAAVTRVATSVATAGIALCALAVFLAACEGGGILGSGGTQGGGDATQGAQGSQGAQSSPGAGGGAPLALETEDEKTSYALGYQLGRNLRPLDLSAPELDAVKQGIADAAAEAEPRVDIERYAGEIEELAAARASAAAKERRATEADFLAEARSREGAVVLDSGVIVVHESRGEGPSPDLGDRVTVHYHGTFPNGEVFDSSMERGQPATFPLSGIIPCWTEALQRMNEGGRAQVICPPETAYGDRGAPPRIPPGATLSFDVELLEVHGQAGGSQGEGEAQGQGAARE